MVPSLSSGVRRHRVGCAEKTQVSLTTQYVVDLYQSQIRVIGGGRIRSNSPMSIPLKDLFLTLLVWISRFVR